MNETIKTILERRSVRRYMSILPPEDDIMQIVVPLNSQTDFYASLYR